MAQFHQETRAEFYRGARQDCSHTDSSIGLVTRADEFNAEVRDLSGGIYIPGMSEQTYGTLTKEPGGNGRHGGIYDTSKPPGSAAPKWNKTRMRS